MPKLQLVLILNRYLIYLLGKNSFEELVSAEMKQSANEGWDMENRSRLLGYLTAGSRLEGDHTVTKAELREYDEHIVSHTIAISKHRTRSIRWRYFQYLSLLFTEIYLDRYFRDRPGLLTDLNSFVEKFNAGGVPNETGTQLSPFEESDLNKLAFWNATGSGKTLLMHVNLLQFRHYGKKYGREEVDNVLLITPNEGLSTQHLGEFAESGISAERFTENQNGRVIDIQVIEITKLADESGDKTIATDLLEKNNLIFIDEGHRGISGDQWKKRRDQLSKEGFAFEYSATFGQAVSAAKKKDRPGLIDEYAKSILFDYSYRYFYHDGYGKNYRVLNIGQASDAEFMRRYLTGALLAFYQQKRIYHDEGEAVAVLDIANPLWVFVGSKVNAVRTENKRPTSDVLTIVEFFNEFIGDPARAQLDLKTILDKEAGLKTSEGVDIFRNAFQYIERLSLEPARLYRDILKRVFNTKVVGGTVSLDNFGLADGELGLRVGNTESYFGIINIGDKSRFWKLSREVGIAGKEREFIGSHFDQLNNTDSEVNILIGAKKFTEGWSSWRVSTMGLMNIGRGEGSQIIQLFGRGVRLRGYRMSLKRSDQLDREQQPEMTIPENVRLLETLNVFGIRADYMQRFREYLKEEGVPDNEGNFVDVTVPTLPTVKLSEHKLKVIDVKEGLRFDRTPAIVLRYQKFWGNSTPVKVDWFPKVQLLLSGTQLAEAKATPTHKPFPPKNILLLDWDKLFFDLQRFKQERGWDNLIIDRKELRNLLLKEKDWYELYIPDTVMHSYSRYDTTRIWRDVALALLKNYTQRFYQYHRSKWESGHLEMRELTDELFRKRFKQDYQVRVAAAKQEIVDKLNQLTEIFSEVKNRKVQLDQDDEFTAISWVRHLFQPLLFITEGRLNTYRDLIQISPAALNTGEEKFIRHLQEFYERNEDFFENRNLFLLRNEVKRGVGFFGSTNYYPDFILWLVEGDHQYIAFIDPKGLRQVQGFDSPKIAFHKTIKEVIQPKIDDARVSLSSFIISTTNIQALTHWQGKTETLEDFYERNVYFLDYPEYVELMLRKMMA